MRTFTIAGVPTPQCQSRMEAGFVEEIDEITLTNRGSFKTFCVVQSNISRERIAAQGETYKPIYLLMANAVETLLRRNDYEPVICFKSGWLTFQNIPLTNVHRSGFWRVALAILPSKEI